MREIKFRGYKQKSFGCENCLGDLYEGCTELCKCKVGTMISDCSHKLPKGWVVMQFTGFYDSNSKPIYEGDIVEFRPGEIFAPCYWMVKIPNIYFSMKNEKQRCIKILGNIYENPELLDKLRQ